MKFGGFKLKIIWLSIFVGLFAGIFGSLFRILLNEASKLRDFMFQHSMGLWFHILIIIGMWLILMGIYKLIKIVPLIGGSGIPQSRGVIFGRYTFKKPWLQFVTKFFGSLSAIGIGLSLGREGPSVQIGTLGSTLISKYIKTNPTEKRYLDSAGAASGLSAAFTAPIASTIFLIEDTMGWVSWKVTLPALVACIISGLCAKFMIPYNVYEFVPIHYPHGGLWVILVFMSLIGLLGALGGKLFNYLLFNFKPIYDKVKIPMAIKLAVIVLITYVIGMNALDLTASGETELIKQALNPSGNLLWVIFSMFLIIVFTAISFATGLCGSLLLPLIVMGGLMGKAFGLAVAMLGFCGYESTGFFTVIGMSIFFISVVRAPLSGLMLILEMTGQYIVFFPMIIAGTFTYLLGQVINVKPVYHKLYNDMINNGRGETDNIQTNFEVNEDSFLIGKNIIGIKLPGNAKLEYIKRDDNILTINENSKIELGDILFISIKENEYEKLFKVIRTLTNE